MPEASAPAETRRTLIDVRPFVCALPCFLAVACAHETPARQPSEPLDAPSRGDAWIARGREPPPFPASAFSDAPETTSVASRFKTRRIGETDEGEAPRFHGVKADFDFKGADLADALRMIADVGRVNIVVDGDVHGTVTMKLRQVPWDQALEVIAQTHGLGVEAIGTSGTLLLLR